MAGIVKSIAGPAYIAASATNIFTPLASGSYTTLRHLHFCNTTAVAATFTLYIGATGGSSGGTELFKTYSLAGNAVYDYYCNRKMVSTDFLTGICETGASKITIDVEGEQGYL